MTILGASILFARGANTHNQLRIILSNKDEGRYKTLFSTLDGIFASENTRAQREKLQQFIIEYGEEIYRVYSRYQNDNILGQDDFEYQLKK